MSEQQNYITTQDGKRRLACIPAAVLAIIVNEREEVLLLSHPKQHGGWQVINGALEAGETAMQGALRETYEEAGSAIQVRPLGTVHVSTFPYDEKVRYMLSIAFLFAYDGGEIEPGDDMAGSEYRWWSLEELFSKEVDLIIPPGEKWVIKRAIDLYRLWNQGEDPVKQPGFDQSVRGKTKK